MPKPQVWTTLGVLCKDKEQEEERSRFVIHGGVISRHIGSCRVSPGANPMNRDHRQQALVLAARGHQAKSQEQSLLCENKRNEMTHMQRFGGGAPARVQVKRLLVFIGIQNLIHISKGKEKTNKTLIWQKAQGTDTHSAVKSDREHTDGDHSLISLGREIQ